MTEHHKSESTGGFYFCELSPCNLITEVEFDALMMQRCRSRHVVSDGALSPPLPLFSGAETVIRQIVSSLFHELWRPPVDWLWSCEK